MCIRTYEYSDNIGEIDADFAFKNCYLLCILSCVIKCTVCVQRFVSVCKFISPHTLTPSHPTPSHPHTLTPPHPHTLTPSQRCNELLELSRDLSMMQSVLPLDSACEDLEVDSSLSFLDEFVAHSLAQGASRYRPLHLRPATQRTQGSVCVCVCVCVCVAKSILYMYLRIILSVLCVC